MSDGAPTSNMVQDDFDPSPGWALRGYLMVLPAMIYIVLYLIFLLTFSLLTPGLVRKFEIPLIRGWGRGPMLLFGIKLEIRGDENRAAPGGKLLLFNHVNIFDLLILAATWSKGSTVIYKQEFHKIPVMGRLMRFFEMISVDRSNREKAVQSLNLAGDLIREQGRTVYMAPEGTRSNTGKLGPFKKGPFHLALQTGVPLVPLVQRGSEVLAPNGTLIARSGRVRIDYLPPINTENWTRNELPQHMEAVRAAYLQYLADGTT